jgi:hypothetical protein
VVAIVITSLAILTRRWRAATAARRRALGLVLLTAGATLVLLLVIPIADLVSAVLTSAAVPTRVAIGVVPIACPRPRPAARCAAAAGVPCGARAASARRPRRARC